jgi:predicted KAP-like P-loop ATPase
MSDKTLIFYADLPVQSAAQDALGRKKFARELAVRLQAWHGQESLVLALHGAWGSGKSSIKNMALEYLRSDETSCPHIIEFNPWQISGQDQLTKAFFHEIAVQLDQAGGGDTKAKNRAEKWAAYGALLQAGGTLASSLETILPAFGVPGAPLAGAAGKALKKSAELAGHGEKAAARKEKTLGEAKAELRLTFLKGLKKTVLVVIDDIDRLTFEEIRLLFRLVKANADFPRFVYLLLFQKSIAVRALNEECGGQGDEYLEKIVQVGFDVPEVDRQALIRLLCEGIDRILDRLKLGKRFSRARWVNVFFPSLQHYFASLRDVYRFLNVFSFSVSSLSEEQTLEVDPVDLIAVEVLRVFEHEVYRQMPSAKSILTHVGSDGGNKDLKAKIATCLDGLTKAARQPERVRAILDHLFINIAWASGGMGYDHNFASQWKRKLRLCHEDSFDRYFFLLVPNQDVSEREIARFLADTKDRGKMVAHFEGWKIRNVLQPALLHLEAEDSLVKLPDPVPFLTALYDLGDNLPEGKGKLSPHSLDQFAAWRTNALLRDREEADRLPILKSVFHQTTGLFAPVRVASGQIRPEKPDPQQPERRYLVSPEGAKELQAIALEKIRAAAKDGLLGGNLKLGYLLYRWREWENAEVGKAWISELIKSEAGTLQLLVGFANKGSRQSVGSYYQKQVTYIRLKELEQFADLKELTARVNKIAKRGLAEREKLAVKAFEDALERRRRKKPDDDFMEGDDDDGEE